MDKMTLYYISAEAYDETHDGYFVAPNNTSDYQLMSRLAETLIDYEDREDFFCDRRESDTEDWCDWCRDHRDPLDDTICLDASECECADEMRLQSIVDGLENVCITAVAGYARYSDRPLQWYHNGISYTFTARPTNTLPTHLKAPTWNEL